MRASGGSPSMKGTGGRSTFCEVRHTCSPPGAAGDVGRHTRNGPRPQPVTCFVSDALFEGGHEAHREVRKAAGLLPPVLSVHGDGLAHLLWYRDRDLLFLFSAPLRPRQSRPRPTRSSLCLSWGSLQSHDDSTPASNHNARVRQYRAAPRLSRRRGSRSLRRWYDATYPYLDGTPGAGTALTALSPEQINNPSASARCSRVRAADGKLRRNGGEVLRGSGARAAHRSRPAP